MSASAPPPPPRPRWLRLAIPFAVSLAALFWFSAGVDWASLGAALGRVRPAWVAVASALLLGEFGLRALRWGVLLRPLGAGARTRDLLAAQLIGAAANTLLPLRAGELARPIVAANRTGHPLSAVVATAVMERVFDLFGLTSVLLLMALTLPPAPPDEQHLIRNLKLYGGAFGLAAAVALAIFFALATQKTAARAVFERILWLGPPVVRPPFLGLFDGFVAGLGSTRRPLALIQAGALSITMWTNGALAIWCLFQAFDSGLPFGAACFTAVAIALTVALPQAPGFLGVFHVAMEKTMVLWGQPSAEAKAFAVVFWAVSFLPVTGLGLLAMWREGLQLRGLLQRAPSTETSVWNTPHSEPNGAP